MVADSRGVEEKESKGQNPWSHKQREGDKKTRSHQTDTEIRVSRMRGKTEKLLGRGRRE